MANLILIQALAELAYSIAMVDGELHADEKQTFFDIIDSELKDDAWWAKNRFKLLEEQVVPNIDQTYNFAIFAIKTNKGDFTNEMKDKFLNVIEKVAQSVNGLSPEEKDMIDRFKGDIGSI